MPPQGSVKDLFSLKGRVAVITGGAGMLGVRHAEAIAEMGGAPVLVDVDESRARASAAKIAEDYNVKTIGLQADITLPDDVLRVLTQVLQTFGRVDILINNAANNPKMESRSGSPAQSSRLEHFSLADWNQDIAVGLTGAFLCSQIIGHEL